jgi:hypothetical protein
MRRAIPEKEDIKKKAALLSSRVRMIHPMLVFVGASFQTRVPK